MALTAGTIIYPNSEGTSDFPTFVDPILGGAGSYSIPFSGGKTITISHDKTYKFSIKFNVADSTNMDGPTTQIYLIPDSTDTNNIDAIKIFDGVFGGSDYEADISISSYCDNDLIIKSIRMDHSALDDFDVIFYATAEFNLVETVQEYSDCPSYLHTGMLASKICTSEETGDEQVYVMDDTDTSAEYILIPFDGNTYKIIANSSGISDMLCLFEGEATHILKDGGTSISGYKFITYATHGFDEKCEYILDLANDPFPDVDKSKAKWVGMCLRAGFYSKVQIKNKNVDRVGDLEIRVTKIETAIGGLLGGAS